MTASCSWPGRIVEGVGHTSCAFMEAEGRTENEKKDWARCATRETSRRQAGDNARMTTHDQTALSRGMC